MYKADLTEGEIRAIVTYYDNAMLYVNEVEENFNGSDRLSIMTESLDATRHHMKSRINYLLDLLDTGC